MERKTLLNRYLHDLYMFCSIISVLTSGGLVGVLRAWDNSKLTLNFDGEICEKIWNFEDENVILNNSDFGAHPVSYPMRIGGSFSGAKAAGE
jgi:hypothetical protein